MSSSLDKSLVVGVQENEEGWMDTVFFGELCLAPEGFLLETLRAEGRDEDLLTGGVGEERAELGALELEADCGVTGTTLVGATELVALKVLIVLELQEPKPALVLESGSAELGDNLNIARLDILGVILELGVFVAGVDGFFDLGIVPVLENVAHGSLVIGVNELPEFLAWEEFGWHSFSTSALSTLLLSTLLVLVLALAFFRHPSIALTNCCGSLLTLASDNTLLIVLKLISLPEPKLSLIEVSICFSVTK